MLFLKLQVQLPQHSYITQFIPLFFINKYMLSDICLCAFILTLFGASVYFHCIFTDKLLLYNFNHVVMVAQLLNKS